MISIATTFSFISNAFSHPAFLTIVFSISIATKLFLLINLLTRKVKPSLSYYFLVGVLISTMITDVEWALTTVNILFFSGNEIKLIIFWRRISWAATSAQYQLIALFIESLSITNFKLTLRNKICALVSTLFTCFFVCMSIIDFNCTKTIDKPRFEFIVERISLPYALLFVMTISIILTLWKLYQQNLPRILQKQLSILIAVVIIPIWFLDTIQIFPLLTSTSIWYNANFTFASFSLILLVGALYYCAYRMMGLRFLNIKKHVQAPVNIHFMENFKIILDQFSHVTNMRELTHITQVFFKEAFDIPFNRVKLYIRNTNRTSKTNIPTENNEAIASSVELFISIQPQATIDFIKESRLLVYDELAFSNFHESIEPITTAISFLESIQADIYLPVYENNTLIAYIIIDRHARFNKLYSSSEYDEMLIFAQYLGNIVHLMQNKNLEEILKQEKDLKEELYNKHQEINQYRESIRSFLRAKQHKKIGILFYKNRRFTFGNQTAKELIQINPNLQDGHPLTKALKHLAQQVESYKSNQTVYTQDIDGTKLVLSGVPSLEQNNVIICVYYPEISDIIKKQIDILKDPSNWDYLLYLETTKSGKLINQLIPGSGETLLQFKIDLLKTALSKKATLLNMPDKDLMSMVELMHHISLRDTLHIIELKNPEKSFEIAIKLFGISAIFQTDKEAAHPLLEKLDSVGTIFIKNIHLLSLETQEYLAEFIRYGIFRIFKSDHKMTSNVRIICSSNQNLLALVQEEKFSKALFDALKSTTLEMPSLATLPKEEIATLAEGFSEQAISNPSLKSILALSSKDALRIAHQRPASLLELRTKTQQMLVLKSKQNNLYEETQFDPAYEVSDPALVEAARLGKKALKDQQIMTLLWNKFKNQNKIASFLGVNRSSVNRRCKEYNLI